MHRWYITGNDNNEKDFFLMLASSTVVFMLLTSFSSVNRLDNVVVEPVLVDGRTPFPVTGKVTIYGAKGGHKQAG